MSLQTAGDVPIQITSETAGSERRISPSWSIAQLKSKLELITGIPPLSQRLALIRTGQPSIPIEAADEEATQLASFPLVAYAEIHVSLDASFSSNLSSRRLQGLLCLFLNIRCTPSHVRYTRLCTCQNPPSNIA
jgi:hypothetical protein